MKEERFVLNFSADAVAGQVFALTEFLQKQGAYIDQFSVFDDALSRRFYVRAVFRAENAALALDSLRAAFVPLLAQFSAEGGIWREKDPVPILIMASKTGHCLRTLLSAAALGDLPMKVVGVASNHEDLRRFAEQEGCEYHYLPVSKENRAEQEQQILDLMESTGAEFLVLARYMQILSDAASAKLFGRAINIHHSFLPGFKGANPYKQAYDRGVKLIGATAHFVTPDLDEGPIIEQSVERVDHAFSPEQLLSTGRHIESVVLERALRYVLERRVFMNGERTVILR